MKKTIIILLAIFGFAFTSFSQISKADTNWILQESGTTDNLLKVYFTDTLSGWISGENSLLYTTNGGESWQINDTILPEHNRSIDCFMNDGANAWMLVEESLTDTSLPLKYKSHLYRSSDSGISWSKLYTNDSVYLQSVFFADTLKGWAVGSNYSILYSQDGGMTWDLQYSDTLVGLFRDVAFLDENLGVVVGDDSQLFQTFDGGENWTRNDSITTWSTLNTILLLDDKTYWVGGSNGKLFSTENSGTNWTLRQFDISDNFYSIQFKNDLVGWACSANGRLHYSVNGGESWAVVEPGTGNLYDLVFVDENYAWIVGSGGMILKTTNGGGEVSIDENYRQSITNLSLYPNPFRDQLNCELYLEEDSEVIMMLYDFSGRLLLETSLILRKGSNNLNVNTELIGFDQLNPGPYLLKLSDGRSGIVSKLVKMY